MLRSSHCAAVSCLFQAIIIRRKSHHLCTIIALRTAGQAPKINLGLPAHSEEIAACHFTIISIFAASCRPMPRSFETDLRYGNRTIAIGIGLCIQGPTTVHASVHRCKMSFNQSQSLRLLAYSVFLVHFAISIATNISLRK